MDDARRKALEEERRRWRERAGIAEEDTATLDPTPTSKVLGESLVRAAEPYVRDVRSQAFGTPDPPWDSPEDAEATTWYTGYLTRRLRGDPSEEDRILDRARRKLVEGTGFEDRAVLTWIACGVRPVLHPATVRIREIKTPLPVGRTLRRRSVTVQLNGPVSESEFRKIWRKSARVWDARPGHALDAATTPVRRRKEVTPDDLRLWRLMQELPEDGPHTWPDRAAVWSERYGTDVTPDALRVRWRRLDAKVDLLTPDQEEDNGKP